VQRRSSSGTPYFPLLLLRSPCAVLLIRIAALPDITAPRTPRGVIRAVIAPFRQIRPALQKAS
jgi:hypothetical protein